MDALKNLNGYILQSKDFPFENISSISKYNNQPKEIKTGKPLYQFLQQVLTLPRGPA
jgi:hypothetical protein